MPHISRFPLTREVGEEIGKSLWRIVARLQTENEVEKFLGDLLTSTEKIMLAKRLAIALMLEKGYDYRTIREILKVSTGTILGIKNWLERGGEGYKMAIKILLKEEKMAEFWQEIGKLAKKFIGPRTKAEWAKYARGKWWFE